MFQVMEKCQIAQVNALELASGKNINAGQDQ